MVRHEPAFTSSAESSTVRAEFVPVILRLGAFGSLLGPVRRFTILVPFGPGTAGGLASVASLRLCSFNFRSFSARIAAILASPARIHSPDFCSVDLLTGSHCRPHHSYRLSYSRRPIRSIFGSGEAPPERFRLVRSDAVRRAFHLVVGRKRGSARRLAIAKRCSCPARGISPQTWLPPGGVATVGSFVTFSRHRWVRSSTISPSSVGSFVTFSQASVGSFVTFSPASVGSFVTFSPSAWVRSSRSARAHLCRLGRPARHRRQAWVRSSGFRGRWVRSSRFPGPRGFVRRIWRCTRFERVTGSGQRTRQIGRRTIDQFRGPAELEQ